MMRFSWQKDKKATQQPERDVQQIDRRVLGTWPTHPKVEPRDTPTILDHLLALGSTEFEHAIARLLPQLGYKRVKRTGGPGDLGVDIVCYDNHGGLVVVQCKRYAPGKPITGPNMQTFFGMMVHHEAHQGIYVTTSTFTKSAFDLVAKRGIRTIDGAGVVALFARHPSALGLRGSGIQLIHPRTVYRSPHPVQPEGQAIHERPCRFCNNRIQMRRKSDGKWLPFDSRGIPNDCRSNRS